MKKNLFLLAALALAVTSCEKENTALMPDSSTTSANKISLSFDSATFSKATITSTAETWEKTINTAEVLVFNADGTVLYRNALTASDISASNTIDLTIPGATSGDYLDFVVVANRTIASTITTKSALDAELETNISSYNSTYATVSTSAALSTGFVMNGVTNAEIQEGTTTVAVTLKRAVAKVSVNATTSSAFASAYGDAAIKINKATLSKSATQSYLFEQTSYSTGDMTSSFEQVSVADTSSPIEYSNLFYVFENDELTAGSRLLLTLDATYDMDGNLTTTTDQTALTYEVELTGTENGKITRNGAYQITANINGLTGADVDMTVTIADWETLSTQKVDLGS